MLRQGQTCNVVLESAAFEQLHHDELLLVVLADLVHHTDVRMIERRGSTRFAQESLERAYLLSALGVGTSGPLAALEQGLRHGRRFPYHRLRAFRKRGSGTRSSQASR